MKMLIFPFFVFWLLIIYGCSKSDEQFNPETEHYNIENKLISGTGATSFQRVIAGNSNGYRGTNSIHLFSVKQTSDLGYISCGTIWLYDRPGTIILKANNFGETEWLDTITDGFGSMCFDIQETEDSSFVLAGETFREEWHSFGAASDGLLIKIDINGNLVWQKTFSIGRTGQLHKLCTTNDGGFLGLGFGYGDIAATNEDFLIKTNSNGEEIWRKIFEIDGRIEDIENTEDGGFILCGDYGVSKINNSGEEVWSSTVGGNANSIKVLSDGYVICGAAHIAKFDNLGNEIWSKFYGAQLFEESGYPFDSGTTYNLSDITFTKDNNFMAIGGYMGYHHDKDIGFERAHLLKISSEDGKILWIKPFSPEEGNSLAEVQKCTDNGFIIAGTTADFDNANGSNSTRWGYIIKTDENGN